MRAIYATMILLSLVLLSGCSDGKSEKSSTAESTSDPAVELTKEGDLPQCTPLMQ